MSEPQRLYLWQEEEEPGGQWGTIAILHPESNHIMPLVMRDLDIALMARHLAVNHAKAYNHTVRLAVYVEEGVEEVIAPDGSPQEAG